MLTAATRQSILELQSAYPEKRSALIPALHLAQAEIGYLPHDIQAEVADLFGIDTNEVHAVVSFYDMFFEKPVGKHIIHVCKNISCLLRGSDGVLEAVCQHLQVEPHAMTPDGEFTVIPSECLGACDRAPVLLVDDQVVGPVQESDLENILTQARQSPGHPCPACPLVHIEDNHA